MQLPRRVFRSGDGNITGSTLFMQCDSISVGQRLAGQLVVKVELIHTAFVPNMKLIRNKMSEVHPLLTITTRCEVITG